MKSILLYLSLFTSIFVANAQNIRYVKPLSTGTGDGSSWANASHDLQAMMDSLKATGGQVWVAQGTYKPLYKLADTVSHIINRGNKIPTNDRHKSFVLVKDVEVYGGFQGIVTDTDLRYRYFESILSGDIGIQGDRTDNVHHVVISMGDVGTACLDGFTITGGNADDIGLLGYYIYIDNYTIAPFNGAGIYITNSSPLIKNVIIKNNYAYLDNGYSRSLGSIISISGNMSEPKIVNLIMHNNKTIRHSPIQIVNSFLTITNALIYNNEYLEPLYYPDPTRAGTAISNYNSNLIITNSIIANNYYSYSFDTLYKMIISWGAQTNYSFTYIRNSIIWNEYGGTIGNNGYSHDELVNNIIGSNSGGILQGINPLFINSTYGNYHLSPYSPAINAGNNAFYHPDSLPYLSNITTDLDGAPRINCIIDIGCYEYQGMSASYPDATIGKDTTICYGDSANILFNLTGNPNWDIVYTVNNGITYDTIKNISESPYILKEAFTETTAYKLVNVSNNICEEVLLSDSMTITVIPELSLTSNIISDTFCHGEQTKEIIFESNADVYFGWEFISGDTTGLPLGEQTGNFGQYTVENNTTNPLISIIKIFPYYSKDNIYCLGRDTHFTITVLPEPVLQTTLSNDTLCDGEQTKAIAFIGTATEFMWETTGNINAIPAGVQTGNFDNYTVENKTETSLQSLVTVSPQYRLENTVCLGKAESFYVRVFPTTKIQSLTANKLLFCEGDLLELKTEATGADLNYQWYHNNSLWRETMNEFYRLPAIRKKGMGNYHVEATGICGTEQSSDINITVSSDKMLVEKWNDVILVDNSTYTYYGYQWYKDNIPISGATNQFYQELEGLKGCYSVELTLSNGQKERTCECCIDNKTSKSLSVYPNPVRQGETLQIQTTDKIMLIQLYSMEGKLIRIGNHITKTLTTSELEQGVYIISIQTEGKIIYNKKIVII
jgi:hypothetical protein